MPTLFNIQPNHHFLVASTGNTLEGTGNTSSWRPLVCVLIIHKNNIFLSQKTHNTKDERGMMNDVIKPIQKSDGPKLYIGSAIWWERIAPIDKVQWRPVHKICLIYDQFSARAEQQESKAFQFKGFLQWQLNNIITIEISVGAFWCKRFSRKTGP